ncbi:deoxyribodipyrimidine photo-lyase [Altererythrobacter xixiisoli]|uniref:Deoxyribodipyrimidine photo-lyase n=1 Tax=Croceibacterium xixiisoli TaxID=1476466 RepID=A0A6I4TXK3_9SPHN|nr:deoxyribodipyrimidine photo-lyase [Croceibacterium xixiisoli]MXO99083.1 deoxyribodipyrimidine photo-lyase [Croceibacterium xixiisoli]
MPTPTLLWLRQDLRLADQSALLAAASEGAVIPVYVLDDDGPGDWRMGGAQRWWLHHSLASLADDLEKCGSRLILRSGPAEAVLRRLIEETGARRIHAIRHYEPWWRKAEAALEDVLCLHDGSHLVPIEQIQNGSGEPYRVYSAFWRKLQQHLPPGAPAPAPENIPAPKRWPKSESLASWALLPHKPDWAKGFSAEWTPGEAQALARAEEWADDVHDYAEMRDLPGEEGTSLLSAHLHFGEISPRTLYQQVHRRAHADKFLKELAWRDFSAGVITALPDYARRNGRAKYDKLGWRSGAAAKSDLRAWQQGMTGYPIVDAGMRQLWHTGWMHNRVRMICASFLVKHLLIDWRAGERWFWDCLVDADYGNNSVNWQWVAGTGVDANMFGRIMAPLTQSEKFDAGDYIRRWVPELADLPDSAIHDPEAAEALPKDYPAKIIGHREGRERALAAGRKLD